MPVTVDTEAITTEMRDAFADDKPLVITRNVLANAYECEWYDDAFNAITDPAYPARAAADGFGDVLTKPAEADIAGLNEIVLAWTFDNVEAFNPVDAIAIIGHNFGRFFGQLTVTLEVDDDGLFASPTVLASQTVPSFDYRRLVFLNLNTFTRYGMLHFRMRLTSSEDEFLIVPEVGEVFAGPRVQLGRRPNRPWDPRAIRGEVAQAVSKTGATSKYVRFTGQGDLRPTWNPIIGVDPGTGLDDFASLKQWHRQASTGTGVFVFVDAPSSKPREAMLMHTPSADFTQPEVDVALAEVAVEMLEQPPFVDEEEVVQENTIEQQFALRIDAYSEVGAPATPISGVVDMGPIALDGVAQAFFVLDIKQDVWGGSGTEAFLFGAYRTPNWATVMSRGGGTWFQVWSRPDGSIKITVGTDSNIVWTSATGLFGDDTPHNLAIAFDLGNATSTERVKVWLDKTPLTPATMTFGGAYPVFLDFTGAPTAPGCFLLGGKATNGSLVEGTEYDALGIWIGPGSVPSTADVEDIFDAGLRESALGDPDHELLFELSVTDTGQTPFVPYYVNGETYVAELR